MKAVHHRGALQTPRKTSTHKMLLRMLETPDWGREGGQGTRNSRGMTSRYDLLLVCVYDLYLACHSLIRQYPPYFYGGHPRVGGGGQGTRKHRRRHVWLFICVHGVCACVLCTLFHVFVFIAFFPLIGVLLTLCFGILSLPFIPIFWTRFGLRARSFASPASSMPSIFSR